MIRRIHVQNFKSIVDQTVDLEPVTVLIGRSGTGKSNFVRALRFLRNLLLGQDAHWAHAMALEGNWSRILPAQGKREAVLKIELEFTVPGRKEVFNYCVAARSIGVAVLVCFERLLVGGDELFCRARDSRRPLADWVRPPPVTSVPDPAVPGPVLGSLPGVREAVEAYIVLAQGLGFYQLPSTVLGTRGPGEPSQLQVPGLHDEADNYLQVYQSILQDVRRPEIRRGILDALRTINGSVDSLDPDSLQSPQRLIVGHRFGPPPAPIVTLDLAQESDGFRRLFAHLLALYQTPAKLVNIFEEPENALFPGALGLLAGEFKAAPEDNRGQIILTTHSPGLLDHFDVASLRVAELRDGQTVIGPVAAEQVAAIREQLMTPGELLTLQYAHLDQPETAGAVEP
jgi:hypothetical protein